MSSLVRGINPIKTQKSNLRKSPIAKATRELLGVGMF
jgi:hypothetical protein